MTTSDGRDTQWPATIRTLAVPGTAGKPATARVRVVVADRLLPAHPPAWLPLTDDDRARIAALRRPDDVRRFVTGRAIVAEHARDVLGDRSGVLRFERQMIPAGQRKPRLMPGTGARWPHPVPDVSISHSGHLVVVAFSEGADVGVDVEGHSSFAGPADPALRVMLTAAERAMLRTIADVARVFTAKEAVLKCVGWGLAIDPLRVEILHGRVHRFDAPQARACTLHPVVVPGAASAHLALAARS